MCTARENAHCLRGPVQPAAVLFPEGVSEARLRRQSAVLAGINCILTETPARRSEAALGELCLKIAQEMTGSPLGCLARSAEDGRLEPIAGSMPARLADHVLMQDTGVLTNDLIVPVTPIGGILGQVPWRAVLAVPLEEGGARGVLAVGNREGGYDRADLEALQALAPAVASAFARLRAEAALVLAREKQEGAQARNAELEAVNKDLESFTHAASHDMQAPLGRIRNFGALLEQRYRERLEGDGLLFLDLIQQNADRLHLLVEDLLAHALIGQKNWEMGTIAVEAAVQAIVQERLDDIRQSGAEVRIDLPAGMAVHGNPVALFQVLRNLVDNALKYSRQCEQPVIEIGGLVAEGRCRLWVRDNGIGLDMAYKDRIFEMFRRLHTYDEYPGTGVGLALVKKAVEHLGGEVRVESEPGCGATFFLDLPA